MTKKDLFERFESHYGRPPVVVDQAALSRAENARHQAEYRARHPDYREKHRLYMRRYRARGMSLALKRKAKGMFEQLENLKVQSVLPTPSKQTREPTDVP
jgi:hypothetical protein